MSSHSYFVSGGCGFLGQYVVKAIHDYDALSTICVVDLCPRPTLLGIESLPRVRVVPGDLVRPETFLGELHDVEAVIHCAGKISFKGGGHDNPSDENISGTKNLLHAALAQNCPNFIFISSISAVDCRPGHLSDETMIPDIEEKQGHF